MGKKAPNGMRIHDMSGNIYEWCDDIYSSNVYEKHSPKYSVPTKSGSNRVSRGGSWSSGARICRCANRMVDHPGIRINTLGFRLARGAD